MDAHVPFLDAVRAAPDDDAPRLIYADWLDERGDPASVARAEFVRLQVARAASEPVGDFGDEPSARERELLERYGDAWRSEFASLGVSAGDYERGFPTTVHLRDAGIAPWFPEIARLAPAARGVRWLRLAEVLSAEWPLSPPPFRVRALTLDASGVSAWPASFTETLRRSPWLDDVERISFTPPEEGGTRVVMAHCLLEAMRAVSSRSFSSLRTLDASRLWGSFAGWPGYLRRLGDASLFDRVEKLDLSANHFAIDLRVFLRHAGFSRVRELVLRDVWSESDDELPIPGELFDRLTSLDLAGTCPTTGAPLLEALNASLPRMTSLTSLDVSRVADGPRAVSRWIGTARRETLTRLRLDANELGDDGVRRLVDSPPIGESLRTLSLRSNRLGDPACRSLARCPWLTELESLDLRGNEITEVGVRAIRESPRLPKLKRLCV